jgi:hypothetical protein
MAVYDESHFYRDLNVYDGHIEKIYGDASHFAPVPDSWQILVTDVENSTAAVKNGKQQAVNLAATGSIVACLNIAREADVEIPFFFGGDGATVLVPEHLLKDCLAALTLHQERCLTNFDFYLRVGYRSVRTMREAGSSINICRYRRNNFHVMPMIQGNALKTAEAEIKQKDDQEFNLQQLLPEKLNLTGMECKWDKVSPPAEKTEVMSLIINAVQVDQQHQVYSQVLDDLEKIYGEDKVRNPLSLDRLKLVTSFSQLKNEVKMKFAESSTKKLSESFFRALAGKLFMRFSSKGKKYLEEMIELTETLLLDGSINTVITGTDKQREALLAQLDTLEQEEKITYGYYISESSILSCYVTAIDDYHIHFLDGDNGGYTQASKVLKKKIS